MAPSPQQLTSLLAGAPPELLDPELPARVRQASAARGETLIALDDDPTGSQCVRDVPVITSWDPVDFEWAMTQQPCSPVFVLTNSRSRSVEDASRINAAIGHTAIRAAASRHLEPVFLSRSDSTLRGHFPAETDELQRVLEHHERSVDGIVLCPAFPEAGRVTISDTHWVLQGNGFVSAASTEFASDPAFGYRTSHLPKWVEERTEGRVQARDVRSVGLTDIRLGGPERVAELLGNSRDGEIQVVNAVDRGDLDVVALGAILAERGGRSLLYRVGPSFVRARSGQQLQPPLSVPEVFDGEPNDGRGLVVVGSHTAVTSRQLAVAVERCEIGHIELDVDRVLAASQRAHEIERVLVAAGASLSRRDTIVSTSRRRVESRSRDDDGLSVARSVSAALVEIVSSLAAQLPLRFLVTKGGITSSDIVTDALGVRRAHVVGRMSTDGISVWRAESASPHARMPLIIFPGNVGDEDALQRILTNLDLHS